MRHAAEQSKATDGGGRPPAPTTSQGPAQPPQQGRHPLQRLMAASAASDSARACGGADLLASHRKATKKPQHQQRKREAAPPSRRGHHHRVRPHHSRPTAAARRLQGSNARVWCSGPPSICDLAHAQPPMPAAPRVQNPAPHVFFCGRRRTSTTQATHHRQSDPTRGRGPSRPNLGWSESMGRATGRTEAAGWGDKKRTADDWNPWPHTERRTKKSDERRPRGPLGEFPELEGLAVGLA